MDLAATMSPDSAGFVSGLSRAMGPLAAIGTSILSLRSIASSLKDAFDLGGQLSDLANITNTSVAELVILRQAFADTGQGADSVARVINLMQKSLGGINEEGTETGQWFAKLGLNMAQLRAMAPTEALQAIGKAIHAIKDPSQQTAAAMAIFGRSGAQLKNFFADPEAIAQATASLGGMPTLLQENAVLFDRISDTIGRFRTKFQGFWAGLAAGSAPALDSILTSIDAIDFSAVGKGIGDSIALLGQAFRQGQLGDLVGLSLKIGFLSAINTLVAGLKAAVDGFMAYLQEIPKRLTTEFQMLANPSLWTSLAKIALSAFGILGSGLLEIFSGPVTFLQASMDWIVQQLLAAIAKVPGLGDVFTGTPETFESLLADRKKNGTFLTNMGDQAALQSKALLDEGLAGFNAAITPHANAISDTFAKFTAAFNDSLASGKPLIDLTTDLNQLGTLVAGLQSNLGATAANSAAPGGLSLAATSKKELDPLAADRFAKIGLFIGGAGGPAMDHAKRTATATEHIAKLTERLIQVISTPAEATAAVWAEA